MAERHRQGHDIGRRGGVEVGHRFHRDRADSAVGHHLAQVRHRGLGFFQRARADDHPVTRLRPAPGKARTEVARAAQDCQYRRIFCRHISVSPHDWGWIESGHCPGMSHPREFG